MQYFKIIILNITNNDNIGMITTGGDNILNYLLLNPTTHEEDQGSSKNREYRMEEEEKEE